MSSGRTLRALPFTALVALAGGSCGDADSPSAPAVDADDASAGSMPGADAATAETGADTTTSADASTADATVGVDAAPDATAPADTSGGTDSAAPLVRVTGVYDPSEKPFWNRWVLNDGASAFESSGAACTIPLASVSRRDECLHTGELLQAEFPGIGNCSNLQVADTAGAFRWTCRDAGARLVVRSEGLREGVGVRDLIDWNAGTFRSLAVVVTRAGVELARSAQEIWWRNEVVTIDAMNPQTFTANLRVYLARENPGRSLTIGGDGAVLVVRPGVTATAPGGQRVLTMNGPLHAWVEGEFSGAGLLETATYALQVTSTRCTVRGVTVRSSPFRALGFDCRGGRVEDVLIEDAGSEGIYSVGQHTTIRRVRVARTGNLGIFHGTPTGTLMEQVRVDHARGICLRVSNSISGGDLQPDLNRGVVLRDVRLSRCGENGAYLILGGARIRGLHVRQTDGAALYAMLRRSVLHDVTLIGAGAACLDARSSQHTIFSSILCAAGGSAANSEMVHLDQDTSGALLSGLSVFNGTRQGIGIEGAGNTLVSVVAVNNGESGMSIVPRGNRVWNLALSSNNVHETSNTFADLRTVFTGATHAPNVYGGILLFGTGPRGCSRVPRVSEMNAGITAGCNQDLGTFQGLVHRTEIPWFTLAGPVLGDEPANSSDTAGAAARTAIVDWGSFAHDARGWAIDGGAEPLNNSTYPGPRFRGACTAPQATCRIWDHDLSAADVYLKNRLPWPPTDARTTIPLVLTHTFAGATQPQCGEIAGGTWDGAACTIAFLNHAQELSDGNGNGLCESGETCVHAPNYGRYQGHGERLLVQETVNAPPVTRVRLYRYAQNGR